MKLIYALGKPRVSLLNIFLCTIFVSTLLILGLLESAPLWVLWGFYAFCAFVAVKAFIKMRREKRP